VVSVFTGVLPENTWEMLEMAELFDEPC